MSKPGIRTALTAVALLIGAAPAVASHGSPAEVTNGGGGCIETTFEATVVGSNVANMWLVVYADGVTQAENIPIGSSASISVGPFGTDTTVMWHVFGGGERDYDDPHWNGYGTESFQSDITAYAAEVGTFSWVLAGPDDPNPFVTWNDLLVAGCGPEVEVECKAGGWEAYGFKNQGQCMRFLVTGQDSR